MHTPRPRRLRPGPRLALLLGLAALALPGGPLRAPPPLQADGEVERRRNQIVESVERVRRAVVSVRTTQRVARSLYDFDGLVFRDEPTEVEGGLGSGVIFHPEGFVITNAHVIAHASSLFVDLVDDAGQTTSRSALPFAVDLTNDLAILRILPRDARAGAGGGVESFPSLRLGQSDDLMLGETVIAVGNPFKLGLSVSTGVVAGLDRKLSLGRRVFDDFVQVTAAVNPGNSGGALLDVTGRWIGVTTAIYARVHGAEGIAFAIPADRVRTLVGTAFRRRVLREDWLGLDEAAGPDGEPVVKAVFPRGPAAGSGLEPGDVLLSLNGALTPTLYDYSMAMFALPPGAEARLTVRRRGRELEAPITLRLGRVPTDELALRHLGLEARDVTSYEGGVTVTKLRPGGPAERIGLRLGDVIIGLGPWRLRNSDELLIFLQMVQPGDLVRVIATRLARDGVNRGLLPQGTLRAE